MTTVLVPGVLALLPQYASIEDPVADLRAACLAAVGELGPCVRVVASTASARRVGAALAAAAGAEVAGAAGAGATGVLVVGNGSAKRTERAPGHLDERSEQFDAGLRAALTGDVAALGLVDLALAQALWADVGALVQLPALVGQGARAEVLYDDAPFGVQYWVVRWR